MTQLSTLLPRLWGGGHDSLLSQQQGFIIIYFYYMKRILFLFFSTSFDLGPALAPSFVQLSDPSSQGTRFLQKPTVVSYCDRMMSPSAFPGCLNLSPGRLAVTVPEGPTPICWRVSAPDKLPGSLLWVNCLADFSFP